VPRQEIGCYEGTPKGSPSPTVKRSSTIHGCPKRGVGILNNELYVGRLAWNRLRYLKDPDTGRRVSRLNPDSEWVIQEVWDAGEGPPASARL